MGTAIYKEERPNIGDELFKSYNHLGAEYPFYIYRNSDLIISRRIKDIIEEIPSAQRSLDVAGVIEIISKSYLLADRTLINQVKRTPWMGKPGVNGEWQYSEIPIHSNIVINSEQAARILKGHLKSEMLVYVEKKKSVGILLSGGLDSRIVAGILRELQLSGEFKGNIVAFTWGIDKSRDVIYARDICEKFSWDWKHIELNAKVLRDNIFVAAEYGAEFSALHLHGIPQLRETKGIDIIIAGSYGDGVGRAEYSGRHLLKLDDILPRNLNLFGLLKNEIVNMYRSNVVEDAYGYKKCINRTKKYQYREIEQEMHYMRRKLQACMNLISEKIPLYQLFTAPNTFGFMWSLDPRVRDNKIYEIILKSLPDGIGLLPWARTGESVEGKNIDTNDTYRNHHKYGIWLRRDLNNFIKELVLNDNIINLGIFNEKALVNLVNIWSYSNTITTNTIDEVVSWLASLSLFLDIYKINNISTVSGSLQDGFITLCSGLRARIYQIVREKFRS